MNDLRKAAEMALESMDKTNRFVRHYAHSKHTARLADAFEEAKLALRQALAQPNITGDSATRSADSAESFCKQELHNLMSVAGRMALELECLLLDTKDLSVVSKWWDTGMESLQAYRDYIWSITHGRDEIVALAQPEQEPVKEHDKVDYRCECCGYMTYHREHLGCIRVAAPPKREWVGLTSEELASIVVEYAGFPTKQLEAIEAKLKEKNT